MQHKKRAALALAALLALALAPLGSATHPGSTGPCTSRTDYVPEDALETTYPVYIASDPVHSPDILILVSLWIYAEGNGQEGLQRDDASCYTPGTTEETRDTLIF